MRYSYYKFISVIALIVGFSSIAKSQCNVQQDGIYVARVDSNTNAYIKFFGKDSVLTTTSDIPKKISNSYIIKEYKEYILHGTYKQTGCFIRMKVSGIMGEAQLEGYFIENNLGLSKINIQNSTYTDLFFFYKEY